MSQSPSPEWGIHRGLGQVDDTTMKADTNPATRPKGRREERDEWQRWRRRRYMGVGGEGYFKNNNNYSKKTNNREKKNK